MDIRNYYTALHTAREKINRVRDMEDVTKEKAWTELLKVKTIIPEMRNTLNGNPSDRYRIRKDSRTWRPSRSLSKIKFRGGEKRLGNWTQCQWTVEQPQAAYMHVTLVAGKEEREQYWKKLGGKTFNLLEIVNLQIQEAQWTRTGYLGISYSNCANQW